MPQGKSWRARLIKWYRKTFNRPRIYKTIATGEGQTPAGDVSMPKRKVGTLEARLEALQVT